MTRNWQQRAERERRRQYMATASVIDPDERMLDIAPPSRPASVRLRALELLALLLILACVWAACVEF
jgi:hypothetical protein